MARYDFGGTLADFVVTSRRLGGLDTLALSAATLTFWDSQSGGARYTDLQLNGSSVSSISVGPDGQVPKFQGPDGVTEMWVDGGSPRIRVVTLQGAPGPIGPASTVAGPKGDQGVKGDPGAQGLPGPTSVPAIAATTAYVAPNLARNPDLLITGTVTRDANGAATSAPVTWPDGTPGTYTATTVSSAFPGAVDAYTITYGSPVTKTYTQPLVTRDANGAAVTVPAVTVA